MLHKLQANVKELGLANLTCQVADAQDLSFASDCSYDAITFSLGLHFVPDKTKYVLTFMVCSFAQPLCAANLARFCAYKLVFDMQVLS